MAEQVEQSDKKPKRRLRPSGETIRERTEKATQATDKPTKQRRSTPKPVRVAAKPFGWLFRLVVPGFLRRSFGELRQVTWPKRREGRQLTTAVIIFSVVFGVAIALLDYGISELFKKVIINQ